MSWLTSYLVVVDTGQHAINMPMFFTFKTAGYAGQTEHLAVSAPKTRNTD